MAEISFKAGKVVIARHRYVRSMKLVSGNGKTLNRKWL